MRSIRHAFVLAFVTWAMYGLWAHGFADEAKSPVDEKTKAQVLGEIERYVTADVKLKKQFFLVDPRTDQVLRLSFDHVHEGAMASGNGYVACVDFKDKAGVLYDVDVLVALEEGKSWVESLTLHKVDGKPLPEPDRAKN